LQGADPAANLLAPNLRHPNLLGVEVLPQVSTRRL
jgi:hypothetical protein